MSIELTRLLLTGNRSAKIRLAGIALGVAVGVALFLQLWGAYNGMVERDQRSAWTQPDGDSLSSVTAGGGSIQANEIWAASSQDYFEGHRIRRLNIAADPGAAVTIPGLDVLPKAGTFLASPALAKIMAATAPDQLANRYGVHAGELPDQALASPDSLVVLAGQSTEQLATAPNALAVDSLKGESFGGNPAYQVVASIGGIAVLIPVLLLVGIVSDLGAAERRERYATLRLIGAKAGTVGGIAAAETAATSLVGALCGVGLYLLAIPVTARIAIGEGSFFERDLLVDTPAIGLVVTATVVATALVAWSRTVRGGIGPLGASKQQQETKPRLTRMVPLIIGVCSTSSTAILAANEIQIPNSDLILITGFIFTTIGLLWAGPLLTYLTSRFALLFAGGGASVIALNRIRRTPRSTFRAVSGLVVAVFLVSVFSVAITSVREENIPVEDAQHLSPSILIGPISIPAAPPEAQIAELSQSPGIEHVGLGYYHRSLGGPFFHRQDAQALGLIVTDSSERRRTPETEFIRVNPGFLGTEPLEAEDAPNVKSEELTQPIILIQTDGTIHGLELARTAAASSGIPFVDAPRTRRESWDAGITSIARNFADLANVGVLITTIISAIALGVATAAGVLDRRRIFGLLRLTGMSRKTLGGIIAGETALPLATVFGVCVGLGILTAWTIVAGVTEGRRSLSWPAPSYYATLSISVLLAGLAVAATLRVARKIGGNHATRFD